jgi:hypothetical protein
LSREAEEIAREYPHTRHRACSIPAAKGDHDTTFWYPAFYLDRAHILKPSRNFSA